MSRLKRFLTSAIIATVLCLAPTQVTSTEDLSAEAKYAIIKNYIKQPESHKYLQLDSYESTTAVSTMTYVAEEDLTGHNHFKWTWTLHFLVYKFYGLDESNGTAWVEFSAKEYQEFVTADSRGFVVIHVVDYDLDGHVDAYTRDFYLVMQNDAIMLPKYPEGLINPDWYHPSQEELDEILQKELNYWVKMAGKEA